MSRLAALAVLLFALAAPSAPLAAQGCSQCRESVGQTSPQTRQAYRRGIAVLMFAGTAVFAAAVLSVRHFR